MVKSTQIRPKIIHDSCDGTTSEIRCSYRVLKDYDKPVMLHVGHDGKIWIGYGVRPAAFSLVAYVGDRETEGTGRDAICHAANIW